MNHLRLFKSSVRATPVEELKFSVFRSGNVVSPLPVCNKETKLTIAAFYVGFLMIFSKTAQFLLGERNKCFNTRLSEVAHL